MAAPLSRAHLRPRGVALATVASVGFVAAGASSARSCAALNARDTRSDSNVRFGGPRRAAASFAAATLVGSLLLATLAVLDARLARAAPEVIVGAGPRTRARLALAPSLTAPYGPFPGLRHRHVVRSPQADSPGRALVFV